jgi:hypothetical protein
MLLEREHELQIVADALDAAVAGQGSVVIVEGPAGILRDERPLQFEHALVRDAVLSGMTAATRAAPRGGSARPARAGPPPRHLALVALALVIALAQAG